MTRENYSINKYIRIVFYLLFAFVLAWFAWAQIFLPSERDAASEGSSVLGKTGWNERENCVSREL